MLMLKMEILERSSLLLFKRIQFFWFLQRLTFLEGMLTLVMTPGKPYTPKKVRRCQRYTIIHSPLKLKGSLDNFVSSIDLIIKIGIWSVLSFYDICNADRREIYWVRWWPSFTKKKIDSLPLICQKNPSHHYINNEISLRNWKKGVVFLMWWMWRWIQQVTL